MAQDCADSRQIEDDARALTAVEVTLNPLLADSKLRNQMQIAMGPKTTLTANGKSIDQVRSEKQSKARAVAGSALPASHQEPSSAATRDIVRNSRFYRNQLSASQLTPQESFSGDPGNVAFIVDSASNDSFSSVEISQPEDPVKVRTEKVRRVLAAKVEGASEEDWNKSPVRKLRKMHGSLIRPSSTPDRSTERLIADAVEMGKNTPETITYLTLFTNK